MPKRLRESEFIDFNTGIVKVPPLQLQFRTAMAGETSFADLVRLYQCRTEVWQLGVAVQMLQAIEYGHPPSVWSHAAYTLLGVLFAYFESVGRILNPDQRTFDVAEANFVSAFRDVYPTFTTASGQAHDPGEFYRRARFGLFAWGSTDQGLWVHNTPTISPQDFDVILKNPQNPTTIKYYINPHTTTRTIIDHFPTVIARLNDSDPDNDALRARFLEFIGETRAG
jgi:hypothetical protein